MGEHRVRSIVASALAASLWLIAAGCGDRTAVVIRDARHPTPLTPADAPVGYYVAAATEHGLVLAAGQSGAGPTAVLPGAFRWTAADGWTPLPQLPDGFSAVGGVEVEGRVFFIGKDCSVAPEFEECEGNLMAELVDDSAWEISKIPTSVIDPLSSIGFVRVVEGRYLSVTPDGSPSAVLALYDPTTAEWSDIGYPGDMGPMSMNQLCQTDGNTFAGAWTQLPTPQGSEQRIRYRMWAVKPDLEWSDPVEVTATVVFNGSTTVCGLGSMMFQNSAGRQTVLERVGDNITAREISVPEPVVAINWGAGSIGERVVGPPATPEDAALTELGTRPVEPAAYLAVEADAVLYLLTGPGALPDVQVLPKP